MYTLHHNIIPMANKIFKALSYILHPVFMPLLGVLLIFSMSHMAMMSFESKRAIVYLVAIVTILFPLALVPLFYFQKVITGFEMSAKKERLLPLFLTSVFYFFAYYLLRRYAAPLIFQQFLLGVFMSIGLAAFINIGWKISLHMIGIGGVIGLLSALSNVYGFHANWVLMLFIFAAGLIGTGRMYLKEHSAIQVYGGFLLGYVLNFGVLVLYNL